MSQQQKSNIFKTLLSSYAVWAFLALLVLNFTVQYLNQNPQLGASFDKRNYPYRTWAWWATKDLEESRQAPQVVLLGSSLINEIVHGADATYLNSPQNPVNHHRSYYLEKLLKEQDGQNCQTYSLAIGGQMASDAYVLTRTLLKDRHKPNTIVYGVAPRDFVNNGLHSPATTETYRYMARIGDLSDLNWQALRSFEEKRDYLLGQASSLYKNRLDFLTLRDQSTRTLLQATGRSDLNEILTPAKLRSLARLTVPDDNAPNEIRYYPYTEGEKQSLNDLDVYRVCYLPFKEKEYKAQLNYFQQLMSFCRQNNINMVIVNMPISPENIAILPQGFYDRFKTDIANISREENARYIDLGDKTNFPVQANWFRDSAHLNGYGAMRFLETLAGMLKPHANSQLAQKKHHTL